MSTTTPSPASGLCARASVISAMLARPADVDLLWQVLDPAFATNWMRDTPEAQRGLALLQESAQARESVARLEHDFTRIFLGEDARVRPLESEYVPGSTTSDLESLYAEFGFRQIVDLPADHLANELSFFSQLSTLTPSPETYLTMFARTHLRPWAGTCLAAVSMSAATFFYQGVGAIGMDFVESLPTH